MIRVLICSLLLLNLSCREKTWPYGWVIEQTILRGGGSGNNAPEFDIPACSRVHILDDFQPKLEEFGKATGETLVEFRNLHGYIARKEISPSVQRCMGPNNQKSLTSALEVTSINNFHDAEFAFSVDSLVNVEEITVDHGTDASLIADIATLKHLKHLTFFDPKPLPDLSLLSKIPSLQSLMLTLPKDVNLPAGIANIRRISYLGIRKPDLCVIPSEIGSLENLERLMFFDRVCFTQIPPELTNLKKLREIFLVGEISEDLLRQFRTMFPKTHLNMRPN